ncbi:MAG: DNA gyrase/topoisomerase IV subunit A [Candidatus Symbiothrix sp.]|jgi:topoisomerase-4 subunit A|nr:DNA gyrase/topoisomerase IV subunit A [Candidatus Symbiothrix sp.]
MTPTDLDAFLEEDNTAKGHSDYKIPDAAEGDSHHILSGMYKTWFMDYASYVITDRAVPHINDGLKPVQRRILHAMKRKDDGRYNKVANIVGETMQFHPHGDQSIGGALVQLGQKDLLIDCQGNWGNILTGDGAAAPRYIEARLSKFALDVVFNPKTTEWKLSYDGRNKEPITLPLKFPLLLAQGGEGIAVGLQSKVLPHNFNELLDACIAYLKGEEFTLYPDFQTGGQVDISRYNDGERGGSVKVRAKITKVDNKTLIITEIPFGKTTTTLTESILKANDKGKIKLRKVDDMTAKNAEIVIHLAPGVSSDKTIDALYAFTDCEISISQNCCVIDEENKPQFMRVSDVLKQVTDNTVKLLTKELEIELDELNEEWHRWSLEKIFFEKQIYKELEKNTETWENQLDNIETALMPYQKFLKRTITRDDVLNLCEKPVRKISRFDIKKADETIAKIEEKIKEIKYNLKHIIDFAINWFQRLKDKYGKNYPRKTEIRSFDTIEATQVVEANEKLYVNRDEGFIGYGLKKDEYICPCSDIDDVIVFFKDGKYKIVKVSEKQFIGKNILYLTVFKRNDNRTIYNVIYRDGKQGANYIKRFSVTGITRDKEYDVTQGTAGSRILYFSANPNGEAETVKVILKPKPRQKLLVFDKNFGDIAIKGRASMGNILTKADIHKISLKTKGGSTLGGRQVWFDRDISRINYDGRGEHLGEFFADDLILVILKNGIFYTTNFDASNHYQGEILKIEKFNPNKIWSVALFDAEQQGFPYLKRFTFEVSNNRLQSYLGENQASKLLLLTDTMYPRLTVTFGGNNAFREALTIDVEEFIAVKGFKAKGKRITTFEIAEIKEIEPIRFPEPEPDDVPQLNIDIESEDDDDEKPMAELLDEITGQQRLF